MAYHAPSAATLLVGAWSYKNAMDLLLPELKDGGSHNLRAPFAMLNGFALELGLKAFLRSAGQTDKQVQRHGHNLVSAHEVALSQLPPWSNPSEVEELVTWMSEPHRRLLLRYIPADVEAIPLPDPVWALAVTARFVHDITDLVPSILAELKD